MTLFTSVQATVSVSSSSHHNQMTQHKSLLILAIWFNISPKFGQFWVIRRQNDNQLCFSYQNGIYFFSMNSDLVWQKVYLSSLRNQSSRRMWPMKWNYRAEKLTFIVLPQIAYFAIYYWPINVIQHFKMIMKIKTVER